MNIACVFRKEMRPVRAQPNHSLLYHHPRMKTDCAP